MGFDHSNVLDYYRESLAVHQQDARRVAWRTRFDQELRFEGLLEARDDSTTRFSLLDVGCGLGDLVGYLQKTGRDVDYYGVDIVPEMVEEARVRYPHASFSVRDLLADPPDRTFDMVVASGSLTIRIPNHELFVRRMLEAMIALADEVVAVNLQSTRAFRANPLAVDDPDLFHVDPVALYGVCRQLCRWTVLREDLLTSDLVVYLYTGHARTLGRYQRITRPIPDPVGVAWLLLERNLPRQALARLDGVPEDAESSNLRGMAHHRLGELSKAEADYRRALQIDAGYEPARLNLAGLVPGSRGAGP